MPAGNYESAASNLLWLQMMGFADSAMLSQQIEQIQATVQHQPSISANNLSIDNHGQSLFITSQAIHELILARALTEATANKNTECQIINTLHPIAFTQAIADAASAGLFAAALYHADAQSNQASLVYATPEQTIPRTQATSVQIDHTSLWLCYASSEPLLLESLAAQGVTLSALPDAGEAEQIQHYQNAIYHGISIPAQLWQTLTKIASGVLVESSEQSRRGAGA